MCVWLLNWQSLRTVGPHELQIYHFTPKFTQITFHLLAFGFALHWTFIYTFIFFVFYFSVASKLKKLVFMIRPTLHCLIPDNCPFCLLKMVFQETLDYSSHASPCIIA